MKKSIFAVCFSLAGLLLAPGASAQSFGDFFVGGGWSVQPAAYAVPNLPPERVADYKPLAENLQKRLPEGTDLRESLILALQTCLNTSKPHIGAFVLPSHQHPV